MSTFSPREVAQEMYTAAMNCPRSVFGLPGEEVREALLSTLRRAETAVRDALAGPVRRSVFEVSDTELTRMMSRVREELRRHGG